MNEHQLKDGSEIDMQMMLLAEDLLSELTGETHRPKPHCHGATGLSQLMKTKKVSPAACS